MNIRKMGVAAFLAIAALVVFVSCEGPMGPAGPKGADGADGASTSLIADVTFDDMVTADIADSAKIKGASWAGDGTITAAIVDRDSGKAFVATYVDSGENPGNGGWWWSDNNAAFVGDAWVPQSALPETLPSDRWVRVYFDYYVEGDVDPAKPALIMFKPVGKTGGSIEYSDYKYGNTTDMRFEIPPGTQSTGEWKSAYVDMVLGQVSKKAGDENKWYTGVALSFEFQGTNGNGNELKLGVDNVKIVSR